MIKKFSYVLLIIVTAILLTACKENANAPASSESTPSESTSNETETTTASNPDQLVIAIPADVTSLDPAITMDNTTWKIIYNA